MPNPFGYKKEQAELQFIDEGEEAQAVAGGQPIIGLELGAGAVMGGGATQYTVQPGSCISNNQRGSENPRRMTVATTLTLADFTAGAGQQGDGAGGAFVAITAGEILGVHLVQNDRGVVRTVLTEMAAIAEDTIVTLAATDVCSKLIGFIVAATVNTLHNIQMENVGPGMRRTTLLTPSGILSEVVGAGGPVIGVGAIGSNTAVVLPYPPATNYRRKVVVSFELNFAGGAAAGERGSIAHGDGDPLDADEAVATILNQPDVSGLSPRQQVELFTEDDGQTVQTWGDDSSGAIDTNLRVCSFDTRLD